MTKGLYDGFPGVSKRGMRIIQRAPLPSRAPGFEALRYVPADPATIATARSLQLLPFPNLIGVTGDQILLDGEFDIQAEGRSTLEALAREQLRTESKGRRGRRKMPVVLWTFRSGQRPSAIAPFLCTAVRRLSDQGYVLTLDQSGLTIAGKTPIGTLYGVQTFRQILAAARRGQTIPALQIVDQPDVAERYVEPLLTWYSHFHHQNSCFGTQLWTFDKWKWFVDWCLLHKINGIQMCLCGYWPFEVPEYPETVLRDIPVVIWDRKARRRRTILWSHPNVARPFLQDLRRYAHERGLKLNAYLCLNSYTGGYAVEHPDAGEVCDRRTDPPGMGLWRQDAPAALCMSRADVRKYYEVVAAHLAKYFDLISFEDDETSCAANAQCTQGCVERYWQGYDAAAYARSGAAHPVEVRMRHDADFINLVAQAARRVNPDIGLALRWHCLMGFQKDPRILDHLKRFLKQLPADVEFMNLATDSVLNSPVYAAALEIIGRHRVYSGAVAGGEAALPRRLFGLSDVRFKNGSQAMSPGGHISIVQEAALFGTKGVHALAFEFYGHEFFIQALAQYGWNAAGPAGVKPSEFFKYSQQRLYGDRLADCVNRVFHLVPAGRMIPPYRTPPPAERAAWLANVEQACVLMDKAVRLLGSDNSMHAMGVRHLRLAAYRLRLIYRVLAGHSPRKLLPEARRICRAIITGEPWENYFDCFQTRHTSMTDRQQLEHCFHEFRLAEVLAEADDNVALMVNGGTASDNRQMPLESKQFYGGLIHPQGQVETVFDGFDWEHGFDESGWAYDIGGPSAPPRLPVIIERVLPEPKTVARMRISFGHESRHAVNFILQYKVADLHWHPIAKVEDNHERVREIEFAPITARAFRLILTRLASPQLLVWEWQIFRHQS